MSTPHHPQLAQQMTSLMLRMAGSPQKRANGKTVREELLGLVKEVDPNYRLPADVAVENLKNDLKAEREQEKKIEAEQRAKNRREQNRKKLVESHGEDVVKAIEEGVLKKYPNLDWEAAAVLHANEQGPVRPGGAPDRPKHGQFWEFPDIPGLMSDPTKAASDMAYAVIDEIRGRR